MSYLSLARKYRPNNFADLVGQESVGLALANAIKLKREPRGVIFTGVRGIGKTTTARIYAKALNCEKGPTPEPCNVCASCLAIQNGTHEDVLEIDGASNTGVDDVRALQETLAYVPQRSSFKIYIIDEVHMLSVSAFNALLKTLEEPPEHVVFIFATTELHKVPETIQSRCQVFHLQKISTQLTKKRLANILEQEGLAFEDRAIQWIAREGKGSLRDALTLLDQVIAVGGGQVTWSAVEPMVNTGHAEPIYQFLQMLLAKDASGLLNGIARWDQDGLPMTVLVEEVVKACRNAFVLKALPANNSELDLLDLEEREQQALRTVGQSAGNLEFNRIFRTFVKCLDDLRNTELDRFVVENYAMEWCLDPGLPDIVSLLQGQPQPIGGAPRAATPIAQAVPSAVPASPAQQAPVAPQASMASPPNLAATAAPAAAAPAAPKMDLRERWKKANDAAPTATTPPPPAPAPVQAAPVAPAPAPVHSAPIPETRPVPPAPVAPTPVQTAPAPAAPIAPTPAPVQAAPVAPPTPVQTAPAPAPVHSAPIPETRPVPPTPVALAPAPAVQAAPVAPAPAPVQVAPAAPVPAAPATPAPAATPSPRPIQGATSTPWPSSWKDFVDEWKKQKPLQARVLEETYSLEYSPQRIKLAVEADSLAGQKLLHIDTRKKLTTQFEQLFGFRGLFEVVPKSEIAAPEDITEPPRETLLETKQKVKAQERDDLRSLLQDHPLTREAIEAFDGTIEGIEVQ